MVATLILDVLRFPDGGALESLAFFSRGWTDLPAEVDLEGTRI